MASRNSSTCWSISLFGSGVGRARGETPQRHRRGHVLSFRLVGVGAAGQEIHPHAEPSQRPGQRGDEHVHASRVRGSGAFQGGGVHGYEGDTKPGPRQGG